VGVDVVTKNIKDDYDATGSPTGDDSAAFEAFTDEHQGQTGVTLIVPGEAGENYRLIDLSVNRRHVFRGISGLTVQGTGAPQISGWFYLGGPTILPQTPEISARIASARIGDTSLTLLNVGDAYKFEPGRTIATMSDGHIVTIGYWLVIADLCLQEFAGPQTPQHFEFLKLASIVGSTIFLDPSTPVGRYSYSSRFPNYEPGTGPPDVSSPDQGGPATIYALDKDWDIDHEYRGNIRFRHMGDDIIYACGRDIRFMDGCNVQEAPGISPTLNKNFTFDAFDGANCGIEFDKFIDRCYIRNGSAFSSITIQSAACNEFYGSDSSGYIQGTPGGKVSLVNWNAPLQLGPSAYGVQTGFVESVNGTHSIVSGISPTRDNDITNPLVARDTGVAGAFTLQDGIISLPLACGPVRWAVPGHLAILYGAAEAQAAFMVLDVWADATHTRIRTTLEGSTWPNIALQGDTVLNVMAHPCLDLRMKNCVGSNDAINLSQPGAYGKPAFSYSKWTYTKADTAGVPYGPRVWGQQGTIRIDVIQPYAGPGPLTVSVYGQFDPLVVINLKEEGERVLVAGQAPTGAKVEDVLTPLLDVTKYVTWGFNGPMIPFFSSNVSAGSDNFSVSIEFDLNHRIAVPVRRGLNRILRPRV
jgi:hypothetical protein